MIFLHYNKIKQFIQEQTLYILNTGMLDNMTEYDWLKKILKDEQPAWPEHQNTSFEDQIWQTGLEQGVLGLCSHKLSDVAAWNTVTPSLTKRLRTFTLQAVAGELIQTRELIQVLTAFKTAHIKPILIKGAPLSYTIYPAPHLRPRCDTDLLFPDRETAEKAWEQLRKIGYERPNAVSGDLVSQEFTCFKTRGERVRHCLDLHWKLSNNLILSGSFEFTELLSAATTIPELADSLALGPVHALLLACIHRIAHKGEQNDNRLIWLYDIHLLCHAFTRADWQDFVTAASKKNLCGICQEGLQQTVSALSTSIPTQVLNELSSRSLHEKIKPEIGRSRRSLEIAKFRDLASWPLRLQFIKENMFPDQNYMMQKYRTTNRLLLPFLYAGRILQGLPKLFK